MNPTAPSPSFTNPRLLSVSHILDSWYNYRNQHYPLVILQLFPEGVPHSTDTNPKLFVGDRGRTSASVSLVLPSPSQGTRQSQSVPGEHLVGLRVHSPLSSSPVHVPYFPSFVQRGICTSPGFLQSKHHIQRVTFFISRKRNYQSFLWSTLLDSDLVVHSYLRL